MTETQSLAAASSSDCLGLPREDNFREYWVLPQNIKEAYMLAAARAFAEKRTLGFSYDDAGVGALARKTAVLLGIPRADRQTYIDWYAEHYPCTQVVFRELPSPHIANIGLHASADPGDLYGGEIEFREFEILQPGVIKVLSAHSETSVQQLASEHPGVQLLVHAFLSMNGRSITPQQFYDWTINDLTPVVSAAQYAAEYSDFWRGLNWHL